MRVFILYVLFLFLSVANARSQKLTFENIGVRTGLPSTEVYHVIQDAKGYVWVFTEYGIVKYDGSGFSHVCRNIPVIERTVYSVFQKKGGLLYFTNSMGNVYCVKNDLAYRIKGLEKSKKEIITNGLVLLDLFVDNNNGLYFSTSIRTYYYPRKKYSISGNLKDIGQKSSGTGYFCFKKLSKKVLKGDIVGSDGEKYADFFSEGIGSRVLVKRIGNKFYQIYKNKIVVLFNNKVSNQLDVKMEIISFEVDKEKHLWLGLLNGGLIELDNNLNILNHYFDRLTVSSILFDNQNGLWVSTIENGIYHCEDIKMKSYKNVELMNTSISMIKSLNGKLFVGTYKGSLFVKEAETFRQIPIKNSVHAITDIEYCSGEYMVGSPSEMWFLSNRFKFLRRQDGASFGLSKMDDEQVLSIFPVNIILYNFKTNVLTKKNDRFGKVRGLVKNKKGEFFTISSKGILKIKDFKYELPKELRNLNINNVGRLKLDQEDNLWLCSKGSGLFCWTNRHKLIHYKNLPTNFVNDICFTKNGFVIISTNIGTFANRLKTIGQDSWDMIYQGESIRNSVFDDQIFIGTKFGLNSIHINELERKKTFQFYLKSVLYNQRPIQLTKRMMVNYDQNNLEFNYDILNYQSSGNKLEYVLEGPVMQKGSIPGTQIQLQNLSPGEYTLKVKPITNIKGSDLSITTQFIVRPAFWQTWIFRIVAGIIILSLIFLVFWFINHRRHKRLHEINEIENLLTESRLTALKSQVNSHFMSNSLVAIQRLILENDTDKANQYIAKFSLLLRSLFEYSNRSSATLRNELNMIELYVELEQLRFDNQFVFEVKIDPHLNLCDIHMPALITHPFVENAIWHGLLPLDGKKEAKLILSIQTVENGILISVIDNGVGREANRNATRREFKSRGTSLIAQRLENLNRLYHTTGGRVEYIDLKDEHSQPIGTQVNIWLPKEILTQLYVDANS